MRLALAGVAALCLSLVGPAWAQVVTLHYQERPPYSHTELDGRVVGLVATPAERALRAAGVPFRWALTPSQRQLALVQSGQGLHCGIGWFRTDARAALGRFSRALYRDRPFGALVRAETGLAAGATAAALLADARWTLLVKEGYAYGAPFDALIARHPARVQTTAVDPPQMARMLQSARADWMIVAPEEAAALGLPALRLIPLADAAPGQTRHLYCSRDVPPDWLARIDAALPALPER